MFSSYKDIYGKLATPHGGLVLLWIKFVLAIFLGHSLTISAKLFCFDALTPSHQVSVTSGLFPVFLG